MDMDQCEQGGGGRFLLYWRTSFMDDSLLHGKCSGTRFAATTSAGGGGIWPFLLPPRRLRFHRRLVGCLFVSRITQKLLDKIWCKAGTCPTGETVRNWWQSWVRVRVGLWLRLGGSEARHTHNSGYIFHGVCFRVTSFRDQRPWRRYALYWVPFYLSNLNNAFTSFEHAEGK